MYNSKSLIRHYKSVLKHGIRPRNNFHPFPLTINRRFGLRVKYFYFNPTLIFVLCFVDTTRPSKKVVFTVLPSCLFVLESNRRLFQEGRIMV